MAFKAEPRLQPDSNDQQQEADATGDGLMPIAIVGMSCRFSGGASGTQQLWDMLCGGLSGWSEGPGDRFNMASFYHPDFAKIGCVSYCSSLATSLYCTDSFGYSLVLVALIFSKKMLRLLTGSFSTSTPLKQ